MGDGVGSGVGVEVGKGNGVGEGVGSGMTVGAGDGVAGMGVTGEEQAPAIITPVMTTHASEASLTVTADSLPYETGLNLYEGLA